MNRRDDYKTLEKDKSKYFFLAIGENILDVVAKESLRQRKDTDLRKILKLIGMDSIFPYLKLEYLDTLMPDVVDDYGKDKNLNLIFNPNINEDEEMKPMLDKGN